MYVYSFSMMALNNRSHVAGGVLCQDYSGSHLHVGWRVRLGCNLTMGWRAQTGPVAKNRNGHTSEILKGKHAGD